MNFKTHLLSCPCLPFESNEEFREFFHWKLKNEPGGYSIAVNAEKIIRINEDSNFKSIAEKATYPIVDGVGAQIVSLITKGKRLVRINLPIESLIAANDLKLRVFILGAEESVNQKAYDIIQNEYPNIKLVGRINGFDINFDELIDEIKTNKPNIILIALGSPKQENLAIKLSKIFSEICLIGCGGALDVLTGKVKRAPEIIQKLGLEWFYRLLQNPKRIKRQIKLPKLFWLILIKKSR